MVLEVEVLIEVVVTTEEIEEEASSHLLAISEVGIHLIIYTVSCKSIFAITY